MNHPHARMNMNAVPVLNGKPRKQLSDQLDRLDTTIDALAEGLPEAITEATRDGTRKAIREAITEIVADPEIIGLLKQVLAANTPAAVMVPNTTQVPTAAPTIVPVTTTAAAAPEPKPGLLNRLAQRVGAVLGSAASVVCTATTSVVSYAHTAMQRLKAKLVAAKTAIVRTLGVSLPLKPTLLIAGGVGLAVAVTASVNPAVATAVAGTYAAVATAATMMAHRVRRFVGTHVGG
jgi:hypothetical protein